MSGALLAAGEALFAAAWEARRRAYARGLTRARRIGARVVSIGNLTVGGTGKTTLALHLARKARARALSVALVCKRYRPGPAGLGDEETMFREALGSSRVFAGRVKAVEAARAAAAGAKLVLVDDGFSHWRLARDLDLVLLDSEDLWGGGRLLPAGRLREPRRALQRAAVVIVTRLARGSDPGPYFREVEPYAPAATLAAGRHRISGVRRLDGTEAETQGPARLVTATGSPAAFERSARATGFDPCFLSRYRDHHWFSPGEARRELDCAAAARATLLLTAKDAVRWPIPDPRVAVLEVEWEWVKGGDQVERLVFGETGSA